MLAIPRSGTGRVRLLSGTALVDALPRLTRFAKAQKKLAIGQLPVWLPILKEGLGHVPFALEAISDRGETIGTLPLCYVRSTLFGRFLVSLPYLNTAGILANNPEAGQELFDGAIRLADELGVKHLELRHEAPVSHSAVTGTRNNKVHMRLALPDFPGPLWEGLQPKVRNQVRKGEKSGLTVHWGAEDELDAFYAVFARNMRDLGTPVYSRRLFESILKHFGPDAELCIVRQGVMPIAGALLLHGPRVTEVPSASSLREYNSLNANMLMYWKLLERAMERGSPTFDFGRSTLDGSTFKFKKQWGAVPEPATWQYVHRVGGAAELRPDNPKYGRFIRAWQRLPVPVANLIGPSIVRGIP